MAESRSSSLSYYLSYRRKAKIEASPRYFHHYHYWRDCQKSLLTVRATRDNLPCLFSACGRIWLPCARFINLTRCQWWVEDYCSYGFIRRCELIDFSASMNYWLAFEWGSKRPVAPILSVGQRRCRTGRDRFRCTSAVFWADRHPSGWVSTGLIQGPTQNHF